MQHDLLHRLDEDRERLVERFAARLKDAVPRYQSVPIGELRATSLAYLEQVFKLVQQRESPDFANQIAEHVRRRASQGLSPVEFLKAALLTQSIVRDHIDETVGPLSRSDIALAAKVYDAIGHIAAVVTESFMAETTRRLEAKNKALLRMTEELEAHQRALKAEASTALAELSTHRSLTRKILESLTAGVIAVRASDVRVTLCSERAAQIFEKPLDEIQGANIFDAAIGLDGVDVVEVMDAVRRVGRYPMHKKRLTLPDGRKRWVYLSAERLYDEHGAPEGTVVIVDDVTEREVLIDSFSRYVSRDLVERVLARGGAAISGERRLVTVVFADIRGFSGLAERLSPEALHELLNAYFSVMIDAITAHGGFIDKFIGDKVMALFGTAGSPASSALSALEAAIDIKRAIAALNASRIGAGLLPIELGVGVNSGEVVLGTIGSDQRMSFTAIGDAVNIADRLQHLARAAEIFVGEPTVHLLPGGASGPHGIALVDCGDTPVRGRDGTVRVYRLDWTP